MLALTPRPKVCYPVLLPEPPARLRRARRRRARRSPAVTALTCALILIIPALVYVSQRAAAARAGYAILHLRGEVRALQAERDRLLATVTALKAPDRIERIAARDLRMVPPGPQQLAALSLDVPAVAGIRAPTPSVWDRLSAVFVRSEAAAATTR